MNLGASAIVLRPRKLAEVLDLGCRLSISVAFGLYARLTALILVPLFVGASCSATPPAGAGSRCGRSRS